MNLFGLQITLRKNGRSLIKRDECTAAQESIKTEIQNSENRIHKRITEGNQNLHRRIDDLKDVLTKWAL